MSYLNNIRLFFQGALDYNRMSTSKIDEAFKEEVDDFLYICFSESIGVPLPISYYTLELLPYLEEEIDGWEDRMLDKSSIWESKASDCPY